MESLKRLAVLLALLAGCTTPPSDGSVKQTCLKCGETYDVYSKEQVEPVVEWCFSDGEVCTAGFMLLQKAADHTTPGQEPAPEDKDAADELEQMIIDHCKKCEGCRMALFEPNTWKTVEKQCQRKALRPI